MGRGRLSRDRKLDRRELTPDVEALCGVLEGGFDSADVLGLSLVFWSLVLASSRVDALAAVGVAFAPSEAGVAVGSSLGGPEDVGAGAGAVLSALGSEGDDDGRRGFFIPGCEMRRGEQDATTCCAAAGMLRRCAARGRD